MDPYLVWPGLGTVVLGWFILYLGSRFDRYRR